MRVTSLAHYGNAWSFGKRGSACTGRSHIIGLLFLNVSSFSGLHFFCLSRLGGFLFLVFAKIGQSILHALCPAAQFGRQHLLGVLNQGIDIPWIPLLIGARRAVHQPLIFSRSIAVWL
jgi:hypothetical protein